MTVTLYEKQETGGNNTNHFHSFFMYQTFVCTVAHIITKVQLKAWPMTGGASVISIRETDENGLPTGADLCSSAETVSGTWVNTWWSGSGWSADIPIIDGVMLIPGHTYALVIENIGSSDATAVWYVGNVYTGGHAGESVDGINWTQPAADIGFREYGEPVFYADFAADNLNPVVDQPVTFTSEVYLIAPPCSYLWDFGDTATSTQENPVHTYTVPGFYTVTLTVTDDAAAEQVVEKVSYIWVHPNEVMVPLVDETEVTPSAISAWTDVPVGTLVNEYATGVLVHIINNGSAVQSWGIRRNGNTDNHLSSIAAGAHTWAMVGIDGSLYFEAYVSSADVSVFVYGYTMFGVEFLSPVVEVAHGGGWDELDCSLYVPDYATGLIFAVRNNDIPGQIEVPQSYGIRPHGGSDSFTLGSPGYVNIAAGQIHFVTVGCDTAQICEFQCTNISSIDLYLVGYVFDGATFLAAGLDISPATAALYVDCETSYIDHSSGWVQVQVNAEDHANRYAALRYPGDVIDDYKIIEYGGWKWQRVSADHVFEGKIQATDVNFFVTASMVQAAYSLVTLDGVVKIGSTPVPDAVVFCYNRTRGIFVGHTSTDENGQYTFPDAGYRFEEFLVSAHCVDSQLRRYGQCKSITLLDTE